MRSEHIAWLGYLNQSGFCVSRARRRCPRAKEKSAIRVDSQGTHRSVPAVDEEFVLMKYTFFNLPLACVSDG